MNEVLKKIQEMLSKLPPIERYEAEPAPVVTADDFDKSRGKINVQQTLAERIAAVKATGLADQIIVEEYDVEFSEVLFAKALVSFVNWLEENYDGY